MPYKYRQLDNHASATPKSGTVTSTYPPKVKGNTTKKKPPKRPASHQRQIAANKARDKKSKELGGIVGKLGITRAYSKKPGESEFQYIARGFIESPGGANDIKKVVKKIVKKVRG